VGGTSTAAIENHLLGELEAAIMHEMWRREHATVRDVREVLNAAGRSLAYTTVMTVMSRLVTKGLLVRDRVGRMHDYRAALSRDDFLRRSAARRVQELVLEFGDLAMAQFVTRVSDLSPAQRRRLEDLASEHADP
jgi:predicted transcriptional regulator